ncbi:semaphorin-4E isoform X1 [Hippocampus comes]|uniref:semaphorin-4E isoform X1 n=1 Tax=Hippocampus comes TaxID=109280 RepID=UPI00094ECDC7|nr:PREDICTED: semaphorin-4E-like isoform X1 [Hippocampus comes]XP_019712257.1 PREDICTED: semaphorin-4E-like isoform X2 [Hippocampus comes]XP_019712258.1 PREDICTED: semaphorin-4E-like isoform X1 [Hippocampus comes]
MRPLLCISVFWFLPLASMLDDDAPLDCIPRRYVAYNSNDTRLFREEGVSNYTIMLLQEDTKLLLLGAREALFALDLEDISKKQASVKWEATQQQEYDCKNKGKDLVSECKNYIKILHKTEDNRMYVCGTNAFDPECDYMSYANGKLTLAKTGEDGKGKCPFDPYQRHASIMVDDNLYSATSMNFLGSELVLMRSSPPIRTEIKTSWLNEPNFISLAQLPKSDWGDDDKVYLFFSETAVEYDCYKKPVVVSRVARVCKGDTGGRRTLQRKWTSFLKARLECPVLGSQLPNIIQNTYRWCDPQKHWSDCLFYAIFTPQSDTSDLSAVCAYSVFDINRVFAEGQFKTLVPVETSFIWVAYSGEVPDPRPGSCQTRSLDLPDQTLHFIRDRPLMEDIIQPIGEKPLLERRGAAFTCIVVHQVEAADGQKFHVMFIGTEDGTLLKAVNYVGEMFIIEQIQLFQSPEAIKVLRFSDVTGQLYAGSDYGVVQVPLATCGRSLSCLDCILARDPYCGWDADAGSCVAISSTQRQLIQSVRDGNASLCPPADPIHVVNQWFMPGGSVKLACPSSSNLATTKWEVNGRLVASSPRHEILQDELLILNVSDSDAGRYRCLSMERSKGDQYTATVAEYQLSLKGEPRLPQAQRNGSSTVGLQVVIGLLVVSLVALLAWNFYNGHLPLPWNCNKKQSGKSYESNGQEDPGPL